MIPSDAGRARSPDDATAPATASASLVGESSAMSRVRALVDRVATTDVSVLVIGESGTGKEVVAQALHAGSPRAEREFRAINCGAIALTLIEAELFGFEKGSFTGATRTHDGIVGKAHGGTLFLDEITELPMDTQPPLLRFLETRRYFRVGGTREPSMDVRIVAAIGSRLSDVERWLIEATLHRFAGNKRRAADVLGCSVKTLYNKLNRYAQPAGET